MQQKLASFWNINETFPFCPQSSGIEQKHHKQKGPEETRTGGGNTTKGKTGMQPHATGIATLPELACNSNQGANTPVHPLGDFLLLCTARGANKISPTYMTFV